MVGAVVVVVVVVVVVEGTAALLVGVQRRYAVAGIEWRRVCPRRATSNKSGRAPGTFVFSFVFVSFHFVRFHLIL